MQIPKKEDAKHKAWLYRTLITLYDNAQLADVLRFKGGTCAAMLGILDRFSIDLDFDFVGNESNLSETKQNMEKAFQKVELEIKDQSQNAPQYFLKYPAPKDERNTIKIDTTFPPVKTNKYEQKRFSEIDRIITCQTPETMFANKLIALVDRHQKTGAIAGRDIYDIHHFFEQGLGYNKEVIMERTGNSVGNFFNELAEFIEKEITETILDQDLNTLLPYEKFKAIRKTLKQETLIFIRDEIKRLKSKQ